MPAIEPHNNYMIQASKWGDTWEATANTEDDVRGFGETEQEAKQDLKEKMNDHA